MKELIYSILKTFVEVVEVLIGARVMNSEVPNPVDKGYPGLRPTGRTNCD